MSDDNVNCLQAHKKEELKPHKHETKI
jgi:hypothetical protein